MSNNKIGKKESFWGLINGSNAKNILIPAIQRDYTYGSQTEDTNKVLNNMLDNIKKALFGNEEDEVTLNFVYGYLDKGINYVPLDGQQRLTTLFLLYYYAALNSQESDFEVLKKFSYATRETTKNYCIAIIDNHLDIINHQKVVKSLREAIHDMSWYLPSFDSDPSIRSMQVVIEQIELRFAPVREELWNKLIANNCPVNFYCLDFGKFGLADDLYVKMNARGKKLTEYEIFKSMLLKHIEKTIGNKDLKRELAIKFDNDWTDLVWESIGKPCEEEKLCEIDKAYICLMKLVIRFLSYKKGELETDIKLNQTTIEKYINSSEQLEFINDFLNIFVWASKRFNSINNAIDEIYENIKLIKKEKYAFTACLLGSKVTNGDALFLYGSYLALKQIKEDSNNMDTVRLNIRHLRNIIENSDNEIRDNKMKSLINDVEEIMTNRIINKPNVNIAFNTNQWMEECEKDSHIEEWKKLWKYEEHEFLRGALSSFAPNQILDLSNTDGLNNMIQRLDKFEYIFDKDCYQNDHIIRAALLTIKDYTQFLNSNDDFRIIGNTPLGWRNMLVKRENRHNQSEIMDVIDKIYIESIKIEDKLHSLIKSWIESPDNDKTDWRYYAIKYIDNNYVAYTYSDAYGYYYIEKGQTNTLECIILQSTYFGESNVAWYLLNHILQERNKLKYNMTLGSHAAKEDEQNIYLNSATYNNMQLGISTSGWFLSGLSESEAVSLGIKNVEAYQSGEGENAQSWLIIKPDDNIDYIEWAEQNILRPLESLPGFAR